MQHFCGNSQVAPDDSSVDDTLKTELLLIEKQKPPSRHWSTSSNLFLNAMASVYRMKEDVNSQLSGGKEALENQLNALNDFDG